MDFAAWLDGEGYSPRTQASTLRVVRRAVEVWHEGGDLSPYEPYLRRVLAWARQHPPSHPTEFLTAVGERFSPLPSPRTADRGLRRPLPEPLDEIEWAKLLDFLDEGARQSDVKMRALRALVAFPFPARDLNQNLYDQISEVCHHAPPNALKLLQAIKRTGCQNIAQYAGAPEGRVAYDSLRRILLNLAPQLGRERLTFSDIEATPWEIRK